MTESVEEAVDWAAIEAAARRPPAAPPPSTSRRLSAIVMYVSAVAVYIWILSSAGYRDNTRAAFRGGETIDLRAQTAPQVGWLRLQRAQKLRACAPSTASQVAASARAGAAMSAGVSALYSTTLSAERSGLLTCRSS